MTALAISNIVLWIVVLALLAVVLALTRQLGVLHERIAPVGALMLNRGLAVGEKAPAVDVDDLNGVRLNVGSPRSDGKSTLLLFVSPTCPVCKKLLPIARSFAHAERLDVVLVGDGDEAEQRSMIREFGLEGVAYVNSPQVGMTFQVGKLPYAVLIDAAGVIRAKGLVNNREHLESLLIAEETGFGTIQAYLNAKQQIATNGTEPPREAHL